MARKLASVQEVISIKPIGNADAIEVATVLGWHVVVGKSDNVKPGDKVIFFEIDSFLPEIPIFEFLRKDSYREHDNGTWGFKIRTVKYRGQVSQGLVLPFSILQEFGHNRITSDGGVVTFESFKGDVVKLVEGADLTEALGIIKYEKKIPPGLDGLVEGEMPGELKTDETRVQLLQDMLNKYRGTVFYETEKVDGSSSTFYIDMDNKFRVCGRGWQWADDGKNLMWLWAKRNDLEAKMRQLPFRIALSGEIVGPGIQGNKYKLKDYEIYFFNGINLDTHTWLNYEGLVNTLMHSGLKMVPVTDTKYTLADDIDAIVARATGKSILNPDTDREGIVLRPLTTIMDMEFDVPHGRVSIKAISERFLLKNDD